MSSAARSPRDTRPGRWAGGGLPEHCLPVPSPPRKGTSPAGEVPPTPGSPLAGSGSPRGVAAVANRDGGGRGSVPAWRPHRPPAGEAGAGGAAWTWAAMGKGPAGAARPLRHPPGAAVDGGRGAVGASRPLFPPGPSPRRGGAGGLAGEGRCRRPPPAAATRGSRRFRPCPPWNSSQRPEVRSQPVLFSLACAWGGLGGCLPRTLACSDRLSEAEKRLLPVRPAGTAGPRRAAAGSGAAQPAGEPPAPAEPPRAVPGPEGVSVPPAPAESAQSPFWGGCVCVCVNNREKRCVRV